MSEKSVWLFLFILLYAAFCFFWGVRGSKFNSENPQKYYLADKNVSSWVFFFAATAATFAGLTIISQTSLIYNDGFQYVGTAFIAITVPLGSIFFFKRQWMLSRKFGYITPGEMYYDYYKSDTLRIITVLVTFFVAIPLLAVFFGATGFLVNILSDGYISRDLGMWVISTIVLFYVTRGGFKSVVSVGVVQSWLYFLTVIILGLIIYFFVGNFETFGRALSKIATTPISNWGNTQGYGGGDFNGYFALPGVIQWVAGLGKNPAVGGPWTAMMIFTFAISFMGVVLSPSFSMWSYTAKHPKVFSYYQIWGSAVVVGILLFVFATYQGVGASLLGANSEINSSGLSINKILPEVSSEDHSLLIYQIINLMDNSALWVTGLLAVGVIAAIQSTAAAFLITSGGIITRDLYKTYVNKNISWENELVAVRIITMLIFLAALYLATFAKPAMVIFSGISISIAFQFLIVLLGLIWFPWITRGAAISGIIIGIIIVILTETIGQQISGNRLPWGRWPLTIHSGVWGLLFNVFICFSVSAFSSLTKIDSDRNHRQKYHDFLNDHMGLHPSRTKLRSFAYVIALIWLFFGAGPGQVLGNSFFGEPSAGYEEWILKIPSLWGYQLIWWFFGIGLIWFLASKMDLSTLPNKPIQANDLYKSPDEISGEVNYIDKLGTGYGWILILIGMAIFAIIFYVYFV
jgi:SSS family solute:Na+ symporter|tara:strand:+ start:413 stop:2479 length:2067 start_codon:yes stop_codon:yes gene_type:complete